MSDHSPTPRDAPQSLKESSPLELLDSCIASHRAGELEEWELQLVRRRLTESEIRNVGTSEQVPTDAHTDKMETPRTDAIAKGLQDYCIPYDQSYGRMINFARQLERELACAKSAERDSDEDFGPPSEELKAGAALLETLRPTRSHGGIGACDMGQMCLDCQPRGPNGECPDASESTAKPRETHGLITKCSC